MIIKRKVACDISSVVSVSRRNVFFYNSQITWTKLVFLLLFVILQQGACIQIAVEKNT